MSSIAFHWLPQTVASISGLVASYTWVICTLVAVKNWCWWIHITFTWQLTDSVVSGGRRLFGGRFIAHRSLNICIYIYTLYAYYCILLYIFYSYIYILYNHSVCSMHIVYANVHSRAFALLALITRLPILGGNLPFAKRPISDHSEPIPNLHGKGIFWPHRSWKIQLTAHNHHLKSYFWKVPANILLVGIFAPWSLHCSALSSQSWLGCENAKQLRSGCLSSDRSNGRGSLHLGLLNSARRVHAIWMKRGYCRIYPIMNHVYM